MFNHKWPPLTLVLTSPLHYSSLWLSKDFNALWAPPYSPLSSFHHSPPPILKVTLLSEDWFGVVMGWFSDTGRATRTQKVTPTGPGWTGHQRDRVKQGKSWKEQPEGRAQTTPTVSAFLDKPDERCRQSRKEKKVLWTDFCKPIIASDIHPVHATAVTPGLDCRVVGKSEIRTETFHRPDGFPCLKPPCVYVSCLVAGLGYIWKQSLGEAVPLVWSWLLSQLTGCGWMMIWLLSLVDAWELVTSTAQTGTETWFDNFTLKDESSLSLQSQRSVVLWDNVSF